MYQSSGSRCGPDQTRHVSKIRTQKAMVCEGEFLIWRSAQTETLSFVPFVDESSAHCANSK